MLLLYRLQDKYEKLNGLVEAIIPLTRLEKNVNELSKYIDHKCKDIIKIQRFGIGNFKDHFTKQVKKTISTHILSRIYYRN